jgi:hypothetical protein
MALASLMSPTVDTRLRDHVDKLWHEHPPLELGEVDFTVHDPALVRQRFGRVLDYMARAELEVERNVLELTVLLPDPPEVDRHFYTDVWGPQESRHGQIIDELQVRLGCPPAQTELEHVTVSIRLLGALAHLEPVQDVVRMLYYLTGMTTERSALLAYHRLQEGLVAMGEHAIASTVITPIRRQEPGHYAFYQMSCRFLWARLGPWQQWLVRRLRAVSFAPVGATSTEQLGDVGDMLVQLGAGDDAAVDDLAAEVSRVERDVLWAQREGLGVPPYIARSFREALRLSQQRARPLTNAA